MNNMTTSFVVVAKPTTATLRSACRPASGSQGCAGSLHEKPLAGRSAVRYRSPMAVITPTGHACGAVVTDLDATAVNDVEAAELRSALDEQPRHQIDFSSAAAAKVYKQCQLWSHSRTDRFSQCRMFNF